MLMVIKYIDTNTNFTQSQNGGSIGKPEIRNNVFDIANTSGGDKNFTLNKSNIPRKKVINHSEGDNLKVRSIKVR